MSVNTILKNYLLMKWPFWFFGVASCGSKMIQLTPTCHHFFFVVVVVFCFLCFFVCLMRGDLLLPTVLILLFINSASFHKNIGF